MDSDGLCEMLALRAEGWTLEALGAKYGVTRQTLAARLSIELRLDGLTHESQLDAFDAPGVCDDRRPAVTRASFSVRIELRVG